jgi:hypothetical protein
MLEFIESYYRWYTDNTLLIQKKVHYSDILKYTENFQFQRIGILLWNRLKLETED